jgi:hypothetical protein
MKPWVVTTYPENPREVWYRATRPDGRAGGEFPYTAEVEIKEKHAEFDVFNVPVMFCDTEEQANNLINEILRKYPGRIVLKTQVVEVVTVTIGPIQRATLTPKGLLPE